MYTTLTVNVASSSVTGLHRYHHADSYTGSYCDDSKTSTDVTTRPNFRLGLDMVDLTTVEAEINLINGSHPFVLGTNVPPGTEDVQMLRVGVRVRGLLNPENITEIVLGAKGATADQVSEARLYYTEDVNTFNTSNLLGTITTGPTGTD